jgi:hypothetical protein
LIHSHHTLQAHSNPPPHHKHLTSLTHHASTLAAPIDAKTFHDLKQQHERNNDNNNDNNIIDEEDSNSLMKNAPAVVIRNNKEGTNEIFTHSMSPTISEITVLAKNPHKIGQLTIVKRKPTNAKPVFGNNTFNAPDNEIEEEEEVNRRVSVGNNNNNTNNTAALGELPMQVYQQKISHFFFVLLRTLTSYPTITLIFYDCFIASTW